MGASATSSSRMTTPIVALFVILFLSLISASLGLATEFESAGTKSTTYVQGKSALTTPSMDEGATDIESRSGRIVGKARLLANGNIAVRVSPAAGVFRQKGAAFEVVINKDATISFFKDLSNEVGADLDIKAALIKLNAKPTLVSISGTFDANTNTFIASAGLEIVA